MVCTVPQESKRGWRRRTAVLLVASGLGGASCADGEASAPPPAAEPDSSVPIAEPESAVENADNQNSADENSDDQNSVAEESIDEESDDEDSTGETATDPASDGNTVVRGSTVYTVDADRSLAEAFAYDSDGRIIAVGDEADVIAAAGLAPTLIEAAGDLVLPGFQDAHVHVPEAGINLDVCFMPGDLGLDDYEAIATECAGEQPDSDWVRAAGASLFGLRDTDESPLDVLDRAVPDRPMIVLDDLGHAVWTNSLGLAAAGIGEDDPNPQGGVFHRMPDGELSGLLLEDAQQLVRNAAAPSGGVNDRGLAVALGELAANGVTTISDAGGYWGQQHPEAWQRASAAGDLTVRALNTLYVYPDLPMAEQLAVFEERFSDDPDSLLQFDTAKIYIDGILDLGTALMLDPYDVPLDADYPSGFSYFTNEQLLDYVDELHAIGYRVNFHVIGDAAVRTALDAVEAIDDDAVSIAGRRHRTTHTYLVDGDDLPRFAELGVVADFQQSDDATRLDYHEHLSEFIGNRAFDLIPTAQLVEAGAAVAMSSDWDAGPLPPLGTVERSLTRYANQVADLATAVELVTIDAAYALGHDDTTGSIEVGKMADFVVLDSNIFDASIDDIDEAQVMLTALAGQIVFER